MTYNIYIVSRSTGKAVKCKLENVSERKLQDSCLFSLRNLNTQDYRVDDVEVGSAEDIVYANQLTEC